MLAGGLVNIYYRYCVSTSMVKVLIFVDKEFSLPTNCPKGHGDQLKYWLQKYHIGVLLVVVERTLGSRQDLAVKGGIAVYWNRK